MNKNNNDIFIKNHGIYRCPDGFHAVIIEFYYKYTSKVLKIDYLSWQYETKRITQWVKDNWDKIETKVDSIEVLLREE